MGVVFWCWDGVVVGVYKFVFGELVDGLFNRIVFIGFVGVFGKGFFDYLLFFG